MEQEKPKLDIQTPAFQEDPRFSQGLEDLLSVGRRLTSFDLTGGLQPLQDVVSTSPETTRLFLEGLQAQLAPQFRDIRQQTISDLAANNQLESSVTADRLLRSDEDLQRATLAATTQFGLADINRATQNRIALQQLGLGTLESATGLAAGAEGRRNQFNLTNFENQLGLEIANQPTQRGGLFGGLTGALGGAASGAALGSIIPGLGTAVGAIGGGLIGGIAGGFAPKGTGGQILRSGATLFGGINPRSSATSTNIRDLNLSGTPNTAFA